MRDFLDHATPIWVFALLTPVFSWYSFHMAVEEYTEIVDRSLFRAATYLILGIVLALVTPLIIAVPWLDN